MVDTWPAYHENKLIFPGKTIIGLWSRIVLCVAVARQEIVPNTTSGFTRASPRSLMEGDRACAPLSIYRRSCLSVEKYISPQYRCARSAKGPHEILGHTYKALGHGRERNVGVSFGVFWRHSWRAPGPGVFIDSLIRGLCSKKCSRPKL
jgi:hypothetical protein